MREYKHIPRLHILTDLFEGKLINLDNNHSHYLLDVLRKNIGDHVIIFNNESGEWKAEIQIIKKKTINIIILTQIRTPKKELSLTLFFTPIKRPGIDFLIEKATELGVTNFQPIMTQNTYVKKFNQKRSIANAIEAAEQCERISIPNFHQPISIQQIPEIYDNSNDIIIADETIAQPDIIKVINDKSIITGYIIGPEGGFTDKELKFINNIKFIHKASLGNNILKSETAALTGIAIIKALNYHKGLI